METYFLLSEKEYRDSFDIVTEVFGRAEKLYDVLGELKITDSFRKAVRDVVLTIYDDIGLEVMKLPEYKFDHSHDDHMKRYNEIKFLIQNNDPELMKFISLFKGHQLTSEFFDDDVICTVSDYILDNMDFSAYPDTMPTLAKGIFEHFRTQIPQAITQNAILEKLMRGETDVTLTRDDVSAGFKKPDWEKSRKIYQMLESDKTSWKLLVDSKIVGRGSSILMAASIEFLCNSPEISNFNIFFSREPHNVKYEIVGKKSWKEVVKYFLTFQIPHMHITIYDTEGNIVTDKDLDTDRKVINDLHLIF